MASVEHEPKIVLAANYFLVEENTSRVLNNVLLDDRIQPHVSGLWLPRNLLHGNMGSSAFENVARGRLYENGTYKKLDNPPKLIVDTSASGGDEDIIADLEKIMRNHAVANMVFTLNPTIGASTVGRLKSSSSRIDASYILASVYPERTEEDIQRTYDASIEEVVKRHSIMADSLGISGIAAVAHGGEAVKDGQYMLAMGITHDGEDYAAEGMMKRASTPEEALEGARNADLLIGRAMIRGLKNDEHLDPCDRTIGIVKNNIIEVIERAIAYRAN